MLDLGPRLVLPSVIDWISTTIAPYAKRKREAKALHLHRLITDAFFNQRPHESPLRYADIAGVSGLRQFSWAQSFPEQELKKALGGNSRDYRQFVRLFFDFPEANAGYDRTAGVTKPYVLKPEAVERLTEAWRDSQDGQAVDEVARQTLTRVDFPSNGVIRTSFSSVVVPSLLPLDEGAVSKSIAEAEADTPSSDYPADRRNILALRHAYAARQCIRTVGGMPNMYADYQLRQSPSSGTGRLYGLGLHHVQRMPRTARRLILRGSGWNDFDFRACHPTIVVALMRNLRLEHQAWDEYLSHREGWHDRIAGRLDVPQAKVKVLLNSLVYGQQLDSHRSSSMSRMIGSTAADRLKEDADYLRLRAELLKARPAILEMHRDGDVIRNAVGKELRVNTKATTLLSLILTGYEAWAVDTLCGTGGSPNEMWPVGNEIQVIMHDGWIASSDSPSNLERLLDNYGMLEFGFPLHLRIKRTSFY